MIPNVQVWALEAGEDGQDVYLPNVGDYELSHLHGDVGTVSLSYPAGAPGFPVLHELRKRGAELEVEIRTDGTSATAERALLQAARGDSVKPGTVWQFTGYYLGILMRAAVTPYETSTENGDTVLTGTPGVIVRTLMVRAQARGALLDIDFSSFSNTLDSSGQPWAATLTVTYSPGRNYQEILVELMTKLGVADWKLGHDRALRLYNPGGGSVDRAAPSPGPQVTLEWGRDLTDAPVAASSAEAGTHVLAAGSAGFYTEVSNPTALAQRGRRIEVFRSYGSVADNGTLLALAQAEAELIGNGTQEYTHALILGPGRPVPGVDYREGDWILRGIGGGTERLQVAQWVLRRSSGVVSASVTLGDLIEDAEVKSRRMIEALANGGTVVGTSTPGADVDDGKAPAAPTGLAVTSAAYYDGTTPLASLTAAWAPVLTNEDGTALDDLNGYEVGWRYDNVDGMPPDDQVGGLTTGTALSWSPVAPNRKVYVKVRATDKYGHTGPWSSEFLLVTASDADPPPVPSTPQVSSYLGVLTVQWDGVGSAGEAMDADTDAVEVHISVAGPTFEPDRPLGVDGRFQPELSETFAGMLTVGGVFPIPVGDYGTTYYARLVSVDRTGNASAASVAGSAVLEQVADGDVAAMSVGKLTTGILTALMTVSGLIRTAVSGGRVEISNGGLILYRPSGTRSMRLDAATGDVALYKPDGTTATLAMTASTGMIDMLGKLVAGASATSGARIIVDPTIVPNPTIYFHTANSNAARPAFLNGFSNNNDVGLGINAGAGTNGRYSRVILFQNSGRFELVNSNQQQIGGIIGVEETRSYLAVNNESAQGRAGVYVNDNGSINLYASPGFSATSSQPMGSFGGGFAFHAQGGANGGYRTYTGGGSYLAFVDNDANAMVNLGGPGGAYKTFVIDHPDDPDRLLIHACTESPSATVEYRGTATVENHGAVVTLPPYFEGATLAEDRHVQLTVAIPEDHGLPARPGEAPVQGPALPGIPLPASQPDRPATPAHVLLYRVAATPIRDGRFRIVSDAPDGTEVHWHVQATRSDAEQFEVEPLRTEVEVTGFGPYRTVRPLAA